MWELRLNIRWRYWVKWEIKWNTRSDFIIDARKDATLISIMLAIASYGNRSDPYLATPIYFYKDIKLNLLDFKNN